MDFDLDALEIINYPDPRLRQKARPVEAVDDRIAALAQRMIALMHEARGVGLAAPQVGIGLRLFVANTREEGDGEDHIFINPTLHNPAGEFEAREEGCLSIPEVHGDVRRPTIITIRYLDLHGNPQEATGEGLAARVWQHETDHLDGRLIIDRFNQITRLSVRRRLRELEREAESA